MSNKLFGCLFLLVILGCNSEKFAPDNPLDPDNPDYQPPVVTLVSGPSAGAVIGNTTVTFSWIGNEQTTEYRTKTDSNNWSNWVTDTSEKWEYLDEGQHTFSVQSRYETKVTSDIDSVTFEVDAVKGPALMVHPRRKIVSVGEIIELEIIAEEVTDLTGAEFEVSFDPSIIRIQSVSEGEFFQGNSESIFHYETNNGVLSVLSALLGGASPSVDGTGTLVKMNVKILKAGNTSLDFINQPVLKDQNNKQIAISETVSGLINGS